nr:hypothetical protein [Tanacetum cinerariifolium]
MTTSVEKNSVFRSFFEKQKLTGPNFINWYRQLRLVLSAKDKENYLEHPIPAAHVALPGQQVPPEATLHGLKGKKKLLCSSLYSKQAEQELLQTVREFHACKQEEGQSVSSYVLKMKSYIDNLECLGQPVSQNLTTVNELHAMLKLHKDTLPKKDVNPALHATRAGRVQKNQKNKPHKAAKGGHGKGKGKMGYAPNNVSFAPKPKTPPPKKDNPAKDTICHQCGEIGHCRRNCPVYLAELMKRISYLRELALQKLEPGALSLYVGDGHRAAVEAIRTYHLELSSGLVIVWNISKNNLVYFMDVPRDGIFEIDMSCSNTNDSSMYAISNKRAKINLDSSLLWHCRLGHISKKRIEKLQHDRLISSIDIESLGKCVSYLSGKMARKPYSHQVERAKDLLGLIHTDVFQKEVENQLGKTIKSLRSDHRGKYMSQEFLGHLKEHRIIACRTPPYTPQNNGVTKRRNQTLLGMVRSMMSQTTLPKSFWDYALETAARILNMVPIKKRDTLTKPDKLDPRSFRCIFVGYPKETMGNSFYNSSKNKVFVARNAEFFENDLIDLKASWSVEDLELIQEEDTNPSLDTSLDREEDDQEINEPQRDLGKPANYKAALLDPESKKWLDAMNVEMQSMKDNDVWALVELPPNARTVGSKWLFKKKNDMDDIRAIWILIAIAAYYDYEMWQIDVKTAFLNRHLSKEVYIEQPEGFVNPKYHNHVCKLKLSIYGLKQASRQWNKRFDNEIKKFSFTQNIDEPCVYLKASGSYVSILILYVDDILLMGNNVPMLQDVKSYLERSFAMKDLGSAAYILGIKIYRDRSKRLIGLCQSAYIEKILKRYYMANSKRGTIPMQEKFKLSKSQGASTPAEKQCMQNVPYASAIGLIMYIVRCIRLDVAFTHNITSRFQQNPGEENWTAVKNILKYLRKTKDMFLVYGGNMERELRVFCYTDDGYLTNADDLRSQTGYMFVLNGSAVDWKNTKQKDVWIRKFISGLSIVPKIKKPISMYCDNIGAIAIAKDDGVTKCARHFHAKVHYLRETIKLGDVKIEKIDTYDNLADPFTKALAFPKHSELTRNIRMLPASSFMNKAFFNGEFLCWTALVDYIKLKGLGVGVNGKVISPRRTKLTPTSVEVCNCLKDHLDSVEQIQHVSPLEGELEQVEEHIHTEEISINMADHIDEEEDTIDEEEYFKKT